VWVYDAASAIRANLYGNRKFSAQTVGLTTTSKPSVSLNSVVEFANRLGNSRVWKNVNRTLTSILRVLQAMPIPYRWYIPSK
jgi:hypothetical protein